MVPADLVARALDALPRTRILNVYSASETHEVAAGDVRAFAADCAADARVCPVGRPLDPEHVYILDEAGNRVAPGQTGELYVGGDLLARSYLNLPETTARAFQMDPFSARRGARMYCTGDLARLLPSGVLKVSGRVGGIIKTRGYTVQPGAVEAAVVRHLAARACAVVARGDGLDRQLVAYVVADAGEPRARRALSEHLPHYMIPTLWVELDALPTYGVSAKVDLNALPPAPALRTPSVDAPRERDAPIRPDTMVHMWVASLGTPASAISHNHTFGLGGHSLTRALGFPVPLAPLAECPTLEGHLEAVAAARDGHTAAVQADLRPAHAPPR